jgi:hypothetical protein
MGDTATGRSGGAESRRDRSRTNGLSVLTPPRGLPTLPDLETAAAERADIIRCCRQASEPVVDPCLCGHAKSSHEHYRPGWDCGTCGAVACVDYRRQDGGALRRMLRKLGVTG